MTILAASPFRCRRNASNADRLGAGSVGQRVKISFNSESCETFSVAEGVFGSAITLFK